MRSLVALCAALTGCAHAVPVAEFAPRSGLTTRAESVEIARGFAQLEWSATEANRFHGVDRDGKPLDSSDAAHVAGGWLVGRNQGMAYRWGGFDGPETFLEKVARGMPAGHANASCDARWSRWAAGVDCSGLVSRAWGSPKKFGTRELERLVERLAGFDALQAGDVLLLPGHHVMLFVAFDDAGRTRVRVIEAGSWRGSVWKVVESTYAVDELQAAGVIAAARSDAKVNAELRGWVPKDLSEGF